jgi:hypothetical protein
VLSPPANSTTKSYVNPACATGVSRGTEPLLSTGELLVGWNFANGTRCGVIYRSGVWFRGFEKSAHVVAATLTFYVARSASSTQGQPLSGNVSCTGQLQMGNAMWMNNPDNPMALLGTPYLTFPANRPNDTESLGQFSISNGMFVSLDVTSAVQQWVAGTRPNYGFVLAPERNEYAGALDRCYSVYNGFTLTVDTR